MIYWEACIEEPLEDGKSGLLLKDGHKFYDYSEAWRYCKKKNLTYSKCGLRWVVKKTIKEN